MDGEVKFFLRNSYDNDEKFLFKDGYYSYQYPKKDTWWLTFPENMPIIICMINDWYYFHGQSSEFGVFDYPLELDNLKYINIREL